MTHVLSSYSAKARVPSLDSFQTNQRSTEDPIRTALGRRYRLGRENWLCVPVNISEKIRASYVERASVGEYPRPQLNYGLQGIKTCITS